MVHTGQVRHRSQRFRMPLLDRPHLLLHVAVGTARHGGEYELYGFGHCGGDRG